MIGSLLPEREEQHTQRVYALIATTLLVPVVLYTLYVLFVLPGVGIWAMAIFGLLASTLGAASTLLVIRTWEVFVRARAEDLIQQQGGQSVAEIAPEPAPVAELTTPVEAVPSTEHLARIKELEQSLEQVEVELTARSGDFDRVTSEKNELEATLKELEEKAKASAEDSDHKEGVLQDYQQTIAEQRAIIDKKQQYVAKLEAKVQDLQYEVKTLLQLGELGVGPQEERDPQQENHPALASFPQQSSDNPEVERIVQELPASSDRRVYTHYDAAVQLQKSLDVAKKLTGASHLAGGEGSRFRDLSMDSYAIDLRRLFDSLRSDTEATILLYSQKDGKVLFVNNQVKELSGWTPEKFAKDFPQLIQASFAEWKHAIGQLASSSEAQVRLLTKHRNGGETPLHCYLGVIPEGVFAGHAIGILYPAETSSPSHAL